MIIVFLLIALLIAPPAFADVQAPTGSIVSEDMPVLRGTLPLDQTKLHEGYGDEHPFVSAPFRYTKKAIYWTGRKLKVNRVSAWSWDKLTKTGAAASDAFVVFGKKTEKYHPGMQTISYGVGIALPVLLRLVPSK